MFEEVLTRASRHEPPFRVRPGQYAGMVTKRGMKMRALREAQNTAAFNRGFAVKARRIRALDRLLNKLEEYLFNEDPKKNKLWLVTYKRLGDELVKERVMNKVLLDAFRGAMRDMDAETGRQRISILDLIDLESMTPEQLQKLRDGML